MPTSSAFVRPVGACKCVSTQLSVHVFENLVGPQERLTAVQGCVTDTRIHTHTHVRLHLSMCVHIIQFSVCDTVHCECGKNSQCVQLTKLEMCGLTQPSVCMSQEQ